MATRQDTLRVFLKVSTPHIALGSGSNKNKNKSSERIRNHPTERVQIIPFTQWRLRKMSDSWSHSHSYLLFPRNVFLKSFFQHQVITQTEGKLFRIFDRLSRPIEFWLFFPSFTTLDNLKITFFTYKFPPTQPQSCWTRCQSRAPYLAKDHSVSVLLPMWFCLDPIPDAQWLSCLVRWYE